MEKKDIPAHPDKHIDQDFKGYPHAPAKEEIIKPRTKEEKKSAALHIKDGEKMDRPRQDNAGDGSANAFEGTEQVRDDE